MEALVARVTALEGHAAAVTSHMQTVTTHTQKVDTHIAVAEPHIERVSGESTRITDLLDKYVDDILTLQKVHDTTPKEDIPRLLAEAASNAEKLTDALDGRIQSINSDVQAI